MIKLYKNILRYIHAMKVAFFSPLAGLESGVFLPCFPVRIFFPSVTRTKTITIV